MELTDGMMTPIEMRELRRLAGWTLKKLSEEAKINIAQLSLFENDLAGLGGRQMATCRRLLLAAAAERAAEIATLFAREHALEMAAAS
jgi:transcriptional regulator with XRE-family HTH domain